MKYIKSRATDLELKLPIEQWKLVHKYIGPNRTHGDGYYNEDKYAWIEVYDECNPGNSLIYGGMGPVAIICLTENQHLPLSLHLSVLEVFSEYRNRGVGSTILTDLETVAKSQNLKTITLQVYKPELKLYYKKFGFIERTINKVKIMRKYL